jgi:hypothetical protein
MHKNIDYLKHKIFECNTKLSQKNMNNNKK